MLKIYSKIIPELLLHTVYRMDDVISREEERIDISPNEEFLQVASLRLPKGKTFKPHRHIFQKREINITQESWAIISGKVRAILYDIDNTIIETVILEAGDCSITYGSGSLAGGHTYECIEDAVVLETKNGPYMDTAHDKVFI